jgi:hypothetical protein
MPTYAESKLAPEHYGLSIFYELLPLDAALAEEASAIESDRDAFGDEFDAYRASQLDMVRSVYMQLDPQRALHILYVPPTESGAAQSPWQI